ncbi:glycosyltransferase family 2 protein [Phaeobacter sp. 11ANDIMAR09]|uniref:glycosyltransferase n=1 Tax=Phaeobacter sp. 11ANDIMAR09 TaxID=1225647 RepID=UPI0006C8B7D1|nr:glycosyltransferase family 2 protein [Phaeobacter sp. 11ANDIMAR09]
MRKATILIPAHNEEAVIARTLWYLAKGLRLDDFRVVVIANGCSDATAARVRAVMPHAEVIETERRGKCHALNLGFKASCKSAPIVCLDADLDVTSESLAALLAPLNSGTALASCGKMEVITSESSAAVRAFYHGWRSNPYFSQGKFGGLFALSPEGAARVFPLPEIIGDDEYIRRSFDQREVAFVPDCRFSARAPVGLPELIRVRRRSIRGAKQVTGLGKPSPERKSIAIMLRRALVSRTDTLPIAFYLLVMSWVRLCLMFEGQATHLRWERDLSSRAAG